VAVQGDGARGFEEFAVEGGEDADDVVGAGGGLDDARAVGRLAAAKCDGEGGVLLVDGFHELAYDEWHALYSLDLLLCSDEFALEIPLLILDVFLLKVDVSA
jgi:hypothetical protein